MINPGFMQNPIFKMLCQGMKGGGNPMPMLQQMMGNNPQMASMFNLVNGKSPQQLEQICRNLYKERGIDIDQAAQQMGLKL